jgi:hypothetical protein
MLLHTVVHNKLCLFENKTLSLFRVIFLLRHPCLCPLRMSVLASWAYGLVSGFIEHIYTKLVTTSNYSAIANSHSAIHYSTHLSLLSQLCLHQSSGNRFQRRKFPFLWVPELSPNSSSSQRLKRSSSLTQSLTHQPTHSTALTPTLAAISHQSPTLLATVSRLS